MIKQVLLFLAAGIVSLFIIAVTEKPAEYIIRNGAHVLTALHLLNPIDQVCFDSLGIPMDNYGNIDTAFIGRQYNPLTIAQYALEQYDLFRQGDSAALPKLMKNTRWLRLHTTHTPDYDVLAYSFPWPRYAMTPPWRSAMAQAQAMQVYARVFQLTRDSVFLRYANRLQAAFFIEVDSGGVTYKDDSTHWWFAEYADEGGMEVRVLNGMLVTLLGLYDYYARTGDTVSLLLFRRGVAALRDNLDTYEGDHSTYYSLNREVASQFYQHIHVDLLRELYSITGDSLFFAYAHRWESFLREPFVVRFLRHPNRLGGAIWALHTFILWGLFLSIKALLRKRKNV